MYSDIGQGEVGDCYFLCALTSLCEFPEKITKFFNSTKIHYTGAIEVRLYIHGIPTSFIVDDFVPFETIDNDGDPNTEDKLILSFAQRNEITKNLWAIVLEKAWAKLNLSYSNIGKGCVNEAFEILFPSPVVSFDHEICDREEIWRRTLYADNNHYLIATDISSEGAGGAPKSLAYRILLQKYNLVINHAYAVINVR